MGEKETLGCLESQRMQNYRVVASVGKYSGLNSKEQTKQSIKSVSNYACYDKKLRKTFPDSLSGLNEYFDDSLKRSRYRCLICSKTYAYLNYAKRHVHAHETSGQYECASCEKVFVHRSSLWQHKRNNCKGPYRCNQCDMEFDDKSQLHAHEKACNMLACDRCKSKFPNHKGLQQHCVAEHGTNKPYVCFEQSECEMSFAAKRNRQKHMWMHSKDLQFECDVCDEWFRHPDTFDCHRRTHFPRIRKSCMTCEKTFISREGLRTHKCQKQPLPEASFRRFWDKTDLELDIYRLGDSQCEAIYPDLDDTTQNCPRLADIDNLKRTRWEDNAWKCIICDSRFTLKHNLRRHQILKHPSWKCQLCDETFLEKHLLAKHNLFDHPCHP